MPSDSSPDPVADGRARIDSLDAEIVRLVAARAAVSAAIQAARAAAGGGPIAPGREEQILASYGAALGPAGPDVARSILTLCRGPLPGA